MRLRAPTLEDLEATHSVLQARDIADLGQPDYTLEDLRDLWQLTETDLMSDARVVEDGAGAIIGYGIVENQGSFAAVHPDAEGLGAGSRLLTWLMHRERDRGQAQHRQYVAATNRSAAALLESHGFRLTRSNYRMARPLADEIATPQLPDVTLRPLRATDLEEMHAIDDRAFAEDPGYHPETLTTFREEHLEAHDSAPDLGRVAVIGDQVAGFLIARRWEAESTGYVDILATAPEHQGRGIGRALLLDAFAGFAAAGLNEAQLGVSSVNPRALGLYQSVGMTVRFQADIYERPIG
jgi:mycothiol synthase